MSAHNHAEHVAGCFRCELSREEEMSDRRCDHNTSVSKIDDQTICDGCEETIQSHQEDA